MNISRTLARLLFHGLLKEADEWREIVDRSTAAVERTTEAIEAIRRERDALRGWRDARRDLDRQERSANKERQAIRKRMYDCNVIIDGFADKATAHKIGAVMGVPNEVLDAAEGVAAAKRELGQADAQNLSNRIDIADVDAEAWLDRHQAEPRQSRPPPDTSISPEEIETVRTLTRNGEPECIPSAVILRLCDAAEALTRGLPINATAGDAPDASAIDGGVEYVMTLEGYEARGALRGLAAAARQARQAFRLTREYVGKETLPAKVGWSWYDADRALAAALSRPPA